MTKDEIINGMQKRLDNDPNLKIAFHDLEGKFVFNTGKTEYSDDVFMMLFRLAAQMSNRS